MIVGGRKTNQVRFRKLASGKIVKVLDEQYLRQDVPCGLKNWPGSENNPNCRLELNLIGRPAAGDRVMAAAAADDEPEERKTIDKIFIIDHHFALNQIDLIENCDVLSNVVLADSILKHVNKM